MKSVSFKIAKAIKEAGYPQGFTPYQYVTKDCGIFKEGDVIDALYENCIGDNVIDAPVAMEVWLWLWREKKIDLQMLGYKNGKAKCYIERSNIHEDFLSEMCDPEEAIISAIEYLVENNLIK